MNVKISFPAQPVMFPKAAKDISTSPIIVETIRASISLQTNYGPIEKVASQLSFT